MSSASTTSHASSQSQLAQPSLLSVISINRHRDDDDDDDNDDDDKEEEEEGDEDDEDEEENDDESADQDNCHHGCAKRIDSE